MKRDWRGLLFTPNILVISKGGGVLFDKAMLISYSVTSPQELPLLIAQLPRPAQPLRIFFDAIEHQDFCEKMPPLSRWAVWDKHKMIHHCVQNRFSEGTFVFFQCKPYNNENPLSQKKEQPFSMNGFAVAAQPDLQPWLHTIKESHIPIEGIYSIPFELCQHTQEATLFIVPTRFHELRIIFVDGKGLGFCRFLFAYHETMIACEIERTLHYVCREFQLTAREVRVLSSLACPELQPYVKEWQQLQLREESSESFLLSFIAMQGKLCCRQQALSFQKRWYRYVWSRICLPIGVIVTISTAFLTISSYVQLRDQQRTFHHLQQSVQHLQQQTENYNLEDLQTTVKRLATRLNDFIALKETGLQPLTIFRKLIPPAGEPVQITQLALSHSTEKAHSGARLLLECIVSRETNIPPEEVEERLKRYAQFLQSQFPTATLQYDIHAPPLTEPQGSEDDFVDIFPVLTLQLKGITP
jgi:hypothetical protein